MIAGLMLDKVTIALRGQVIVRVDAVAAPGETLTVMGPSGSGKSTLLRFIAGALMPPFTATGHVRLDGELIDALPVEDRRVGMLFQDDLLFPHLSVGGNLLFGLPAKGSRVERLAMVEGALREVGLEGFSGRDPATLSGGQRARVSLLRVLLSKPRALLLDEPMAKLDTALRRQVRQVLFAEIARRRLPAILVTHDPDDAEAAGGPIIRLDEGRPA
jgi:putative thiamine transport system ATP-binding protein